MNLLQHRQTVHVECYSLEFDNTDEPGAGFSFPCDKDGNVDVEALPPLARKNLEMCLNREHDVTTRGVCDCSYDYTAPATLRCHCGKEVELYDPMTNTCQCGLEYNGGGQLLAPRSQWDYDTYDNYP